jgi:hypothetical protein
MTTAKPKPKKTGTNVITLMAVAEEKSADKPSYAEMLRLLEEMDDVEYDRCRRAKAVEWDIRLVTLGQDAQACKEAADLRASAATAAAARPA